jgi:hypothetical protein
MIKIFYRSICSILLVYFVIACGDKFSDFDPSDQTRGSEIIAQAKRLYETETSSSNLRTSENGKAFKKLEPIWKKAKEVVEENGDTIVFVPVENHKINAPSLELIRYFTFKKHNNNITEGRIVEFLGNRDVVNGDGETLARKLKSKKINNFDGSTFVYDLNYNHLSGSFYMRGEKANAETKLALVAGVQQNEASGRVASTHRTQTEGSCSSYYLVTTWSDGTQTWSFLYTTCGIPPSNPPQGGTISTSTPNYGIQNNLTRECFKSTFNSMLNAEFNNKVQNILIKFNKSNQLKFTIGEYTDATDVRLAKTVGTTVLLNVYQLINASREAVCATIYHEVLHVYLGGTNYEDHNKMANDYVTPMIQALQAWFPLSYEDAEALAWTGLGGSEAWKEEVRRNSTKTNHMIDLQNISIDYGNNCP